MAIFTKIADESWLIADFFLIEELCDKSTIIFMIGDKLTTILPLAINRE
jgi:hypothetical protein